MAIPKKLAEVEVLRSFHVLFNAIELHNAAKLSYAVVRSLHDEHVFSSDTSQMG